MRKPTPAPKTVTRNYTQTPAFGLYSPEAGKPRFAPLLCVNQTKTSSWDASSQSSSHGASLGRSPTLLKFIDKAEPKVCRRTPETSRPNLNQTHNCHQTWTVPASSLHPQSLVHLDQPAQSFDCRLPSWARWRSLEPEELQLLQPGSSVGLLWVRRTFG